MRAFPSGSSWDGTSLAHRPGGQRTDLTNGICFCGERGGATALRTSGKAKHYRYYTCSTAARQSKTGSDGRTIQMDGLDHLRA